MKKSTTILLLFALFAELYGLSCPTGFRLMESKCLKIFNHKMKHLEAETDCLYLGGTLATVKDANENRAVASLAGSVGVNAVWLGMFCFKNFNGSTSCFHDDGAGSLGDYTNFAAGNPAVEANGGCVYMQVNGASAGQWISAPCEVVGLPFVCQVPLTLADPTCTHNYNGYCYTASHEITGSSPRATYDKAQATCQSIKANLVSLHAQTEIEYVKSIYRNSGIVKVLLGAETFIPNHWAWVDATPFDYDYRDPVSNYTGTCLSMDLSSRANNGMWQGANCLEQGYFLCKRKIGAANEVAKEENRINPKFSMKNHPIIKTELLDASNCNATIIMSPGTITSYKYPQAKPPATYCTWNVAALGPYRVGVYFTDFSTYFSVDFHDEFGERIDGMGGNQNGYQVLGQTNFISITHDNMYDAQYGYHGFSAVVLPY